MNLKKLSDTHRTLLHFCKLDFIHITYVKFLPTTSSQKGSKEMTQNVGPSYLKDCSNLKQ